MKNVIITTALIAAAVLAVTACNKNKSNPAAQSAEAAATELQTELAVSGEPGKPEENAAAQTVAASVVTPSGQLQGGGTAASPFLIYTEADLRAIGSTYTTNSRYRLMADITLTGDNDNNPDNGNWMPVGGSAGFNGAFDGNGHTISGLKINILENFPPFTSAGLFTGVDADGMVENLGLIDVSITVSTQGIGGIAGSNYGTIQNCYVTGSIGDMQVKGGIAGTNTQQGTIRNCFFAGTVFHRREETAAISGGIAGVSGGAVTNCVSLAQSVTEEPENEGTAGRVVGKAQISEWIARLANNYGWNGTTTGQNYLYYVAVPASSDPASKDGADLTSAELKTRAAWEKAGFSFGADSMWVWNGARGLPGLKNQNAVVPWPAYLDNPAVARPSPNMGETLW